MPAKSKVKKKGKGKGKSEKNQDKANAKTGEVDVTNGDQEEVDNNADVSEEDAEACEAVAEFSDSEITFGYVVKIFLGMSPTGV